SVTFVWKVNGVTKRTFTSTSNTNATATDTFALSVAGNGDKGDTITVEATPNDGLFNGSRATDSVTVQNSAPLGVDDADSATEAGGVNNGTAGVDPSGNVLTNDTDADGDSKTVSAVRTGAEAGSGTAGTVGSPLAGSYGTLTLNANGTYSYAVNNGN